MIQRLRSLPVDLTTLYAEPHDHARYGLGHGLRVEMTIALATRMLQHQQVVFPSVADLSCGNGVIARALGEYPTLGDFAPGYTICGPLETTILTIAPHDVYVCSETLEHLDDPTSSLNLMRGVARYLVLTTPLECWDDDNSEHLWAWDREGVEDLLAASQWTPIAHAQLDARVFNEQYLYGIWVAQ